ncbi:MAG: hypothetical protein ACI8S7_002229, partial [Candidatus Krumholzibacteriia bacterium]
AFAVAFAVAFVLATVAAEAFFALASAVFALAAVFTLAADFAFTAGLAARARVLAAFFLTVVFLVALAMSVSSPESLPSALYGCSQLIFEIQLPPVGKESDPKILRFVACFHRLRCR